MEFSTIAILLPIICNGYQEMEIISRLTTYFLIDHHILLLNTTADTDRFINRVTPQTVYFLRDNGDVTRLQNVKRINSKNAFMIVVAQSSNVDGNLLQGIKKIQRHQINMKIGLFFTHYSSMTHLHKLFQWCKTHLVTNIFAATYSQPESSQGSCSNATINVFTFNPFGTFEVIDVTSSTSFYGGKSNFHQHKLRLNRPIQNDSNGMFWLTVFRLTNASFVEAESGYSEAAEAIENGVDIVNYLWGVEEFKHFNVYPLLMLPMGILVPESLPYSEFSSYLRNAVSNDVFSYSFVSIAAVVLVLCIVRYIEQNSVFLLQSAADVLNLLLNDNGYIRYQRLSLVECLVIVPITFVGFVVTNCIWSNLKSHLTQPLLQAQINTPGDIYQSSLSILTTNEAWKSELIEVLSNRTKHPDWGSKIVVTTGSNFVESFESFNRTTAYFMNVRYANVLLRMQKRLNIKGYHNTQIVTSITYFTYRVNEKFLLFERLQEIIHRIQASGLYDLWIQRDEAQYEARILKLNEEHIRNRQETYVESFEFPMFLLYGWLIGAVVLVVEIVWQKIQNPRKINRFCFTIHS